MYFSDRVVDEKVHDENPRVHFPEAVYHVISPPDMETVKNRIPTYKSFLPSTRIGI